MIVAISGAHISVSVDTGDADTTAPTSSTTAADGASTCTGRLPWRSTMPWKNARPPVDQRGYGYAHVKARAEFMAQLERDGVGVCCLGGEPIYPSMGRYLHLDHTPDKTGYRGLACARHNRSDGARRGRARQTVTARRM